MAKTKKLAPLPRVTSKTITVGSLLGKIKRLILAEPLRLNMNTYVAQFRGETIQAEVPAKPACGTVACMAGWGAVLLRPKDASGELLGFRAYRAMEQAIGHGRDDNREVGYLFASFGVHDFAEPKRLPRAGSSEHAAFVAKRIDTYLSQHPEIVNRKIVVADVQKALRG